MPLLQVVEDDQISSKKYLAVDEEELAKMIKENQELKRKLAARGMWTLTTATSYVEGHNNTWVVNNILNVPRFHKFLQDTVVSYPPPGKKGVSVSSETMARLLRQMVPRDFKIA